MKTEKQILNIKLMGKQHTKMLNQGRKEGRKGGREGGREGRREGARKSRGRNWGGGALLRKRWMEKYG